MVSVIGPVFGSLSRQLLSDGSNFGKDIAVEMQDVLNPPESIKCSYHFRLKDVFDLSVRNGRSFHHHI